MSVYQKFQKESKLVTILGKRKRVIIHKPNLDLVVGERSLEVDFVLWHRGGLQERRDEPAVVFGEAKSFAEQAITNVDVAHMKLLASALPGCFLVFAVLKPHLSAKEQELLRRLTTWGRQSFLNGRPRAEVIVLTGNELFVGFNLSDEWKELGGLHRKVSDALGHQLHRLPILANATQRLYLGL